MLIHKSIHTMSKWIHYLPYGFRCAFVSIAVCEMDANESVVIFCGSDLKAISAVQKAIIDYKHVAERCAARTLDETIPNRFVSALSWII